MTAETSDECDIVGEGLMGGNRSSNSPGIAEMGKVSTGSFCMGACSRGLKSVGKPLLSRKVQFHNNNTHISIKSSTQFAFTEKVETSEGILMHLMVVFRYARKFVSLKGFWLVENVFALCGALYAC